MKTLTKIAIATAASLTATGTLRAGAVATRDEAPDAPESLSSTSGFG
jgi:hypothetical protein